MATQGFNKTWTYVIILVVCFVYCLPNTTASRSTNSKTISSTSFLNNSTVSSNTTHTVSTSSGTTAEWSTTQNTTLDQCTKNKTKSHEQWPGFLGAGLAVLLFGTNFIPVKKFETGDGVFFQFIMCIAIWCVGLIVNVVRSIPEFHAIVMLGGAMWCTGNMCCVPIIKCVGLGIGLLIWSSFNLISGWASGTFGWFHICPEKTAHPTLNYLGVSLALLSGIIFMFIKVDLSGGVRESSAEASEWSPLLNTSNKADTIQKAPEEDTSDWTVRLTPKQKRVVGIALSVVAGPLFGLSFLPAIYVQDRVDGASQNGLDYVFSHFCGILLTSTFYFIVYCIVKKNKPAVYPRVILPAALSGGMWAVAQSGWFVANSILSEPVSFPIITTGPGLVASFCGIIFFKEIRGMRNYLIYFSAFIIVITGAVLSGLSKE